VAFISVPFDARDLAAAGELERDQRRLAQALHDEAIQRVAAALLLLDIEGLGVDSLARGELEAAIVAGRRLLDDIRPPLLDELGVHQALFSVFEREWPDRGVELDYRGPEGTRWLGRGGGTLLWKALSACVRSAMSDPSVRRVRVSLELLDRLVRGSVRDDGGSRIGLVSADGSGAPGLDGAKVALEAVGGGLHVRTWDEWTEVVFHLHLGDVP
jgi:protein-histidine pros-kinase